MLNASKGGSSKLIYQRHNTCPNCRSDIDVNNFVDKLEQDRTAAEQIFVENIVNGEANRMRHYIRSGFPGTTKSDIYSLLDLEGHLMRRLLLAPFKKCKFGFSEASLQGRYDTPKEI